MDSLRSVNWRVQQDFDAWLEKKLKLKNDCIVDCHV